MVNFVESMVNQLRKWVIGIVAVLLSAALIPNHLIVSMQKPRSFDFSGQTWILPLTVEQAVKRYNLRFSKPNLYAAKVMGGGKMHLEFPYEGNDYSLLGEPNQDSLKFKNRIIHTYCFVFSDTLSTYDSVRAVLQQNQSQSLIAHQDTMRWPVSSRKLMFSKGLVNYEIVKRGDSSYIAIRHQPRQAPYYPAKLQVFFFYGLPYEDIYQRLTVF